jgi:hypothetical protein
MFDIVIVVLGLRTTGLETKSLAIVYAKILFIGSDRVSLKTDPDNNLYGISCELKNGDISVKGIKKVVSVAFPKKGNPTV